MIRCALLFILMSSATPAVSEPAAPDSLIWVSDQAAADSLASYWSHLSDGDWYDPLTPLDLGVGLTAARYDSLIAAGDIVLAGMLRGRPWRIDLSPVDEFRYNRTEGPTLGASVEVSRPGARQPSWTTRLAYAFARKKPTASTKLTVPVMVARPRDAQGLLSRTPWTRITLEADAGRTIIGFAGESVILPTLQSLLIGEDPTHYHERTWGRVGLRTRPTPWLSLWTGASRGRDHSLDVATRWSVFGDESDVSDNLQVREQSTTDLETGLSLRRHGLRFDTDLTVSRVEGRWARRFEARGRLVRHDFLRNEWAFRGFWSSVDRRAPLQWKTWLGGEGSLRGFEAAELVGDFGGLAVLQVNWNVDPLRTLRVPMLKDWALQPLTFVEYGRAGNSTGDAELDTGFGDQGWRADAGFGVRRVMGFGEDGPAHLSLTASRPIGQNMSGSGWRMLVMMEVSY